MWSDVRDDVTPAILHNRIAAEQSSHAAPAPLPHTSPPQLCPHRGLIAIEVSPPPPHHTPHSPHPSYLPFSGCEGLGAGWLFVLQINLNKLQSVGKDSQ